jgi:hypothetical protein
MIHLKYRNNKRIGDLYFPSNFYFECYIDTTIERPQYTINEDAREDQAGDIHRLFQRWEKRQTFRFMGVESLCDAISTLPLMDEVFVNNERVFDVNIDVRWEEDMECLANIEVTYNKDKIIKSL